MIARLSPLPPKRSGITLIEILISIMIFGIGLVSLATLFPIGLKRIQEAQRLSRSAFLTESAASDMAARSLLNKSLFLNSLYSPWYVSRRLPFGLYPANLSYDPFIQDTPGKFSSWVGAAGFQNAGVYRGEGGLGTGEVTQVYQHQLLGDTALPVPGSGLPIAYDPLWRQMTGIYLDGLGATAEMRFGSGVNYIRRDPNSAGDSDGTAASVHGLQRLTNLGPLYGANILQSFVSPEDIVWQEPAATNSYTLAYNQQDEQTQNLGSNVVLNPSPVVPDLSLSTTVDGANNVVNTWQQTMDFRYSWLFTGQQTDAANGGSFDGNLVIMENRPFSVDVIPGRQTRAAGETAIEGVFGFNLNVAPSVEDASVGYGVASNRIVLLRWPVTQPDPEVKVGSWIADVTYERRVLTAAMRFPLRHVVGSNVTNQPPQRCFWYQVAKVTPAVDAVGQMANWSGDNGRYRYMMVWTATDLRAKTLLNASNAQPYAINAALVCPYVVGVFPRTFSMK